MTDSAYRHQELAAGGWGRLSLAEQLGNVGTEVGRLRRWRGKDERPAGGALGRALGVLDLTLADPRLRSRLRETARARELLCGAAVGRCEDGPTEGDPDRYFPGFARP